MQIRPVAPSSALVMTLALVLAACTSGSGESGSSDAPRTSQDQPGASAPAAPSSAPEPPSGGGGQDGSGIDWATVDLTTIDWATIDLRAIDWRAIEGNPTAENLSEDDSAVIESRINRGSATVIIGDTVYEPEYFLCASGHENTESDVYSFSTLTTFDIDGAQVDLQFGVRDPSGTGQTTGDGVEYELDIDAGAENLWAMVVDSVVIDGYTISVSGTWNDQRTPGVDEAIPGSLEAECGDTSRF